MDVDAMNLLEETIEALKINGKSPDYVVWVGSRDGSLAMSWEDFALIAKETDYDSGFGGQEIAKDLIVVGASWWLERHEYDGSEWWEFKSLPTKSQLARPFRHVMGGSWSSLDETQKRNGDEP